MRLPGTTALITGASSGIGRATALHLAREGSRLVLVARSEAPLREVADEIVRLEGGAQPLVVTADVADADAIERMAGTVLEEIGPPRHPH